MIRTSGEDESGIAAGRYCAGGAGGFGAGQLHRGCQRTTSAAARASWETGHLHLPGSPSTPAASAAPTVSRTATPPAAVLSAHGVVKTVGRGRAQRRVLDGVDLYAQAGELVAITGRSGSGKSTLLHLLGGLDHADEGVIEVAGRRVSGAGERELSALRRSCVGYVFQFFHLVPELTGEANVMLAANLPGGDGRAPGRAQELIDRLGIRDVAGSLPHELSGGEQQRFALARALVADPPVVLADEPTGNLDEESAAVALGLLRSVADEGRAVIVVTHELDAIAVADRVLRLDRGRLA